MINLVRPSTEYRDSFIEAVKEFQAEGRDKDIDLNELEGGFDYFISKLEDQERGIGLPGGFVPDSTFWLIDDNEFIGRVSIRHRLTEKLLQEGGHIGYEIRPPKRRLGYGTKILELALPLARSVGIDRVLVTCDDANIGSWKIIEKNGGVLEDKIEFNGKLKRRYWID